MILQQIAGIAMVLLGGVVGVLVSTSSPNGGTLLAAALIVAGVIIAARATDRLNADREADR